MRDADESFVGQMREVMDCKKIYVYTLPKAGTYLMGEFLTRLGFVSTGWHVMRESYLDTLSFDPKTNSETPTATSKPRIYLRSFKKIPPGHFAFGHLSPLFVPPGILKKSKFKIISVRRAPKEILVSEFIDFRFRRRDVKFVSRSAIPDTLAAFEKYMSQHGATIANMCRLFAFLEQSMDNPLYSSVFPRSTFHFTSFERLMYDERLWAPLEIARFLESDASEDDISARWRAAVAGDNKTKATSVQLDLPRNELWTARAQELYKKLGFEEIEKHFLDSSESSRI